MNVVEANRWEVFGRRTWEDPLTAVGAVHAPDAEMALLLAKESFFRHGEGVSFAVCRLEDLHEFEAPDTLQFATDKSYKLQAGYPLGAKRRLATSKAREDGSVIAKPRPADMRVLNEGHQ